MVTQGVVHPGQVLVEGGGGGDSGRVVRGRVSGEGAEDGEAEGEGVGVGDAEGDGAGDVEDAVALAAVEVAEAEVACGVVGDGVGEGDAGRFAVGDEALGESQAVALDVGAGEAGGEHDLTGGNGVATGAGDEGAAVGELRLGVAEEEVQGDGAAERVAGTLGVEAAGDGLRGEAIEVGGVGGLERGFAAELGGGAVAKAVEDDQQYAQAHGSVASFRLASCVVISCKLMISCRMEATPTGTRARQSSPAWRRRRISVASMPLSAPGVRTST